MIKPKAVILSSIILDIQKHILNLQQTLDVDVCSLYEADNARQLLSLKASSGLAASSVGDKLRFSQGLTGRVARQRKPLAAKNPHQHADYYYLAGSGEEQFQSYLGIPLLHGDQLFGVLVIQTKQSKMFFHSEISRLYQVGRELMEDILADRTSLD